MDVEKETNVTGGAFIESLKRTAPKIRADRAASISEDAQLMFKREIEDLEVRIRRMKRNRENMLDMSPDHAASLKLATDFDAKEFVETDLKLGVDIRNAEIKLEIARERYDYLFKGGE